MKLLSKGKSSLHLLNILFSLKIKESRKHTFIKTYGFLRYVWLCLNDVRCI